MDVELEFEFGRAAIEAKLDHELTLGQIEEQALALGDEAALFVLLPNRELAPPWLDACSRVFVIDWEEALACFKDSRLTMDDILGEGRLLKSTVESWLSALRVGNDLAEWEVDIRRGRSGMPSVDIRSPLLPGGKQLRSQIEVSTRRMPDDLSAVRFNSYAGISVCDIDDRDFFDPAHSDQVPEWITHLLRLHHEVLAGREAYFRVNTSPPGHSKSNLGVHKLPLANAHLYVESPVYARLTYLAKGYCTWAIGPKLDEVAKDGLASLAARTAEILRRWYEAETQLR
ncbi:hypothetical protein MN032_01310 [Agromyces atrinae]|uniref:hypothetical protein n=1 Tax=Agromyces atrinae TaxID=592376 RepID=UPI001F5881EE|nr:hypothetical protein [Agromyces atrinae]MCI2956314.1 hypothetical protein [Agromyces atrinae]